jgi:uncharacterized membrane protein YeaQ/YmgE (transglycosylase-associated protein family)
MTMSFERASAGMGLGAEAAAPPPESAEAAAGAGISPAMRLQILSTEHWSLLASRSLAWNESFSRAGMFLSTLSGAIVALALVAQATSFGEGFILFALVILPVVLFIGMTTLIRLGGSNYHDAICVVGMNRIRAGYLELAPDLERFFVMGVHDDVKGIGLTMAIEPGTSNLLHGLAATPGVVSVINAVLVGVILALVGIQLGAGTVGALILAVVGALVAIAILSQYGLRQMKRGEAMLRPIFPSPEEQAPVRA